MRFTRYYTKLLEAQGMPHINIEQHKRLFNKLRRKRLDELERLIEKEKDNGFKREYKVSLITTLYLKQIFHFFECSINCYFHIILFTPP